MCSQEVVYVRAMLAGFGVEQPQATQVLEDNAACIAISENQVNRMFTWHIDVCCYFVQDLVCDGVVKLVKCAGTHNVANALTKSLPAPSWTKHSPWLISTQQEYKLFSVAMGVALQGAGVAAAA